MAIELKTKKWGNSLGIVIPASIRAQLNLKPNENVIVNIEKRGNVLKEMFGAGKDIKKSTEQILKEIREEMKSEWEK